MNKKIDMIIVDNKNKSYYFAEIVDVLNGSNGKKILSPDPSNTPEYYREKNLRLGIDFKIYNL